MVVKHFQGEFDSAANRMKPTQGAAAVAAGMRPLPFTATAAILKASDPLVTSAVCGEAGMHKTLQKMVNLGCNMYKTLWQTNMAGWKIPHFQ